MGLPEQLSALRTSSGHSLEAGIAMWKFFLEESGTILPNDNEGTELMSDAFIWVKRQNPDGPGMTVLAWTAPAKGLFGRSRGESIVRSWRFTKAEAIALAVFAAQQLHPAYERFAPNDDRVIRAIAAASDGAESALEMASNSAALAASDARESGDEAAAFAAESARAAVLAAWGADAGKALHAAAYGLLYSIQGAYKVGIGDEVTFNINKWIDMWKVRA
jgi:hypothetical protein